MAKLILVTIPIGNDLDITERARHAFLSTNLVFCEDTRNFKGLLSRIGIDYTNKKIVSFHDHSNDAQLEKVILEIETEGEALFVSDAGSPVISDPGYPIAKAAVEKGVELETLPGVSAVIAALELSALPSVPFTFHAFLPREKRGQENIFSRMSSAGGTHIFFESPRRIIGTLEVLSENFPNSSLCLAKEITKTFQTCWRFKACELPEYLDQIDCRGEFVVVVYFEKNDCKEYDDLVNTYLDKPTKKELAKLLSKISSLNSKQIYAKLNN